MSLWVTPSNLVIDSGSVCSVDTVIGFTRDIRPLVLTMCEAGFDIHGSGRGLKEVWATAAIEREVYDLSLADQRNACRSCGIDQRNL